MDDFLELLVSASATGVHLRPGRACVFADDPSHRDHQLRRGEWAMVGAFSAYLAIGKLNLAYPLGMAGVLAVLFLIGWGTERLPCGRWWSGGAGSCADPGAPGHAGRFPRGHFPQFRARPVSGAVPIRPGRLEFGRRDFRSRVRTRASSSLAPRCSCSLPRGCFSSARCGQVLRSRGDQSPRCRVDGYQPAACNGAVLCCRCRRGRLAGLLVAPNISAHYLMGCAGDPGFTALVVGGRRARRGGAARRSAACLRRAVHDRYAPIPPGYSSGFRWCC